MTDEKPTDEPTEEPTTEEEAGETPPEPTWQEVKASKIEASKAKVRAIIEKGKATIGPGDDHPIPPDDPAERLAQINRTAWEASVEAAELTDLLDWRLDGLAPDQHGTVLGAFVQSLAKGTPPKRNVILAGTTGPGKTSAAIAAGWAAIDAGLTVRMVDHYKYHQWLRPDGTPDSGPYRGISGHQLRARMRKVDLLIVDDLGRTLDPRAPVSQHVLAETLSLIGDRADSRGKATIVTTNFTSPILETMFGEQFMSRLSKNGHVVKFVGPDRRGRLSW